MDFAGHLGRTVNSEDEGLPILLRPAPLGNQRAHFFAIVTKGNHKSLLPDKEWLHTLQGGKGPQLHSPAHAQGPLTSQNVPVAGRAKRVPRLTWANLNGRFLESKLFFGTN